ncbi:MAG: tRNA-dihydrouridine synthase, partial [Roseibium sp.]
PVIANGDCCEFDDALRMLEASGADGVMVGRGSYGKPWLPGHIGHFLATGEKRAEPGGPELRDLVLEHYKAIITHYGTMPGVRIARKHLGWYLDNSGLGRELPGPLRKTLMTSNDPVEVIRLVDGWFSSSERSAA